MRKLRPIWLPIGRVRPVTSVSRQSPSDWCPYSPRRSTPYHHFNNSWEIKPKLHTRRKVIESLASFPFTCFLSRLNFPCYQPSSSSCEKGGDKEPSDKKYHYEVENSVFWKSWGLTLVLLFSSLACVLLELNICSLRY